MNTNDEQFPWVEKYRPRTVKECILPKHLLDTFTEFVKNGQITNMTFDGPKGSGKTTVARALCEELGCDFIFINGSEENGIDMLRTKLRNFATTVSFNGGVKVAIIDEAEYLNATSTQPAFRSFMEEFSKNCRFIFTCNNKNRLLPALLSRAPVIDFKIPEDERPKMASKFLARLKEILAAEGVEYDEKVLVQVVLKFFPDYRRILGELQIYSLSGKIDVGILGKLVDTNLKPLIDILKEKDFKKMCQWVVDNEVDDSIFSNLFEEINDKIVEIPQLVILLNDYSFKSCFVTDKQLNLIAFFTELMATINFK